MTQTQQLYREDQTSKPEYKFLSSSGIVVTITPANMRVVNDAVDEMKSKTPPPKAPIKKVKTFESVSSGRGYDEIEDKNDDVYLAQRSRYDSLVWRVMEAELIKQCVVEASNGTLRQVISNDHDRIALFRSMVNISTVTSDAIESKMKELVYLYKGRCVTEWPTEKSKTTTPISEIVYNSAIEEYNMTYWEVDKLPIEYQVEIVARFLCKRKVEYLESKDRQALIEAKNRRRKSRKR